VQYAHKLALKKTDQSQGLDMEQGATSHPPDPHHLSFPLVESHGISGQCVSFSLIDAGSVFLPALFFLLYY